MYNFCIFIFIIYAMSYSVSEILFKKQYRTATAMGRKTNISKKSQTKHSRPARRKTTKQIRKTKHQSTFNNKKPSSYKTHKTRTGRKPVRVFLLNKKLITQKMQSAYITLLCAEFFLIC